MSVSTVSTTILTATPIPLPRGLRVNVLLSATAETGPAVDVTYRQSETETIGGLVVVPLVLHVTRAASYGYLLIDVADDAPLGKATLVVDQVGFDQKELAVPVNVVAETGPWWEFVGPQNFGEVPLAGRVTAVAFDPNARDTLYAGGAAGGLWRSTDAGDTWVPLTDWCCAEPFYVSTIAFDPVNAVIYVGSGGGHDLLNDSDVTAINYPMGVFRSSDAGRTWSPVGRELFGESAVSKVFVDPRYPEVIWVAPATPGPVCQSVDSGDTWTKVEALPHVKWTGMERAPAMPDRYYLVGEGAPQLWRTDDGGVEWVHLRGPFSATLALHGRVFSGGVQRPQIACSPISPDTVYLFCPLKGNKKDNDGHPGGLIFQSDDAGETWADITGNWDSDGSGYGDLHDVCFACSYVGDPETPAVHDVLYLGKSQLFRRGRSEVWETVAPASYGHVDQQAIAISATDPAQLLLGNDGGIFALTAPPQSADNVGALAGAVAGTGINLPASSLNATLGVTQIYRADYTEDQILIGGGQDVGTGYTLARPEYWADTGSGGDGGGCAINPAETSIQYASTDGDKPGDRRIYRTGDNWEHITEITPAEWANEPPGAFGHAPLVLDASDPSSLYAGTNFLYRWNEPGAGTDLIGHVQDLWSKHLGGHPLSSPDGYITAIAVAPTNGNIIYAGSSDGQLWMSSDRGNTWRRIDLAGTSQGLPPGGIASIAVHPAKWRDVLVATGADLYRCQNTSLQVPSRTLMFPRGRLLSWARMTIRTAGPVFRAIPHQTRLIELPNVPISSVVRDPASPDERWFVSTDIGVFFTDDGGSSWQTWPGLPNAPLSELKIVPATFGPYLYAASFGRGIWRRSLG